MLSDFFERYILIGVAFSWSTFVIGSLFAIIFLIKMRMNLFNIRVIGLAFFFTGSIVAIFAYLFNVPFYTVYSAMELDQTKSYALLQIVVGGGVFLFSLIYEKLNFPNKK